MWNAAASPSFFAPRRRLWTVCWDCRCFGFRCGNVLLQKLRLGICALLHSYPLLVSCAVENTCDVPFGAVGLWPVVSGPSETAREAPFPRKVLSTGFFCGARSAEQLGLRYSVSFFANARLALDWIRPGFGAKRRVSCFRCSLRSAQQFWLSLLFLREQTRKVDGVCRILPG